MSTLSPQQAPLSKSQAALLFSSSQASSVAQSGNPHPLGLGDGIDGVGVGVGGGGGAVVEPNFGSRHLQIFGILQYFVHSGLGLLQQSPPSQLHPALLLSVSHQPS